MPSSPAFMESREVFKKWVWSLNVRVGTREGYTFPHLLQLLLFYCNGISHRHQPVFCDICFVPSTRVSWWHRRGGYWKCSRFSWVSNGLWEGRDERWWPTTCHDYVARGVLWTSWLHLRGSEHLRAGGGDQLQPVVTGMGPVWGFLPWSCAMGKLWVWGWWWYPWQRAGWMLTWFRSIKASV